MKYIVVAEDTRSARELVGAARAQGADDIVAVVCSAEEAQGVADAGVAQLIAAQFDDGALKEAVADVVIPLALDAGEAAILTSTSRRMINAAAVIAHALGTAPIVDVSSIEGGVASHIKFGGKLIVGERALGNYAVYAVSPGCFEPAQATGPLCPVETMSVSGSGCARVVERKAKEAQSVDLTAAKTIVCVGRGVATREGFDLCGDLKQALGGELGCTRPVTETADPFMPRETYIGASGIAVRPDLFVGVAISGQTQHTMGMYESGTVVVIDKNKDAPFFNMCDFGVVGDYLEVVPALTKTLGA